MRYMLFLLLLLVSHQGVSQFAYRFGVSILAGTHVNRVGGFAEARYAHDRYDVYNRTAVFFAFQSWGPPLRGVELQNQTGFDIGWGKANGRFDSRLTRSTRQYAAGYSYNVYLDTRKTSQVTGSINMQLDKIMLSIENDIFARGYYDRYRTGALRIGYVDSNVYAGLQLSMWTGQHNGHRIHDSTYPGPNGYMNLSDGRYGSYSHGILSAFVQHRAGYATAAAAIGVDADQIRHAVQNKVLHDMPFIPRKWKKRPNAHIPMIARGGRPYVFDFGQRVRPIKPYLQLSLNDTGLY